MGTCMAQFMELLRHTDTPNRQTWNSQSQCWSVCTGNREKLPQTLPTVCILSLDLENPNTKVRKKCLQSLSFILLSFSYFIFLIFWFYLLQLYLFCLTLSMSNFYLLLFFLFLLYFIISSFSFIEFTSCYFPFFYCPI